MLIDGNLDIKSVLEKLYKMEIYTVFVDCGGTLAGAMLKEGLIDEIYQFIAPKILNDNSGKSCLLIAFFLCFLCYWLRFWVVNIFSVDDEALIVGEHQCG